MLKERLVYREHPPETQVAVFLWLWRCHIRFLTPKILHLQSTGGSKKACFYLLNRAGYSRGTCTADPVAPPQRPRHY